MSGRRRDHVRSRASCALALALACACALPVAQAAKTGGAKGGDATSAAAARERALVASTPEQVAADPAQAWTRFLAHGELGDAYERYDAMDAVGYTLASVDAEACRAHGDALREAVKQLPISIAMHRTALLCAEALGDEVQAERETAALAALSKLALSNAGEGHFRKPIRVFSPSDVYALVATLGYEFRYDYYRLVRPERTMPLVVAAWDPDAKVEHHLAFDFIEATHAVDREDEHAGFPIMRNDLVDAFVKSERDAGEVLGEDIAAMQAAQEAGTVPERLDALREAARRGGIASLRESLALCIQARTPGCGEPLVDALLPLAEQRQAMPMVILALAHAQGVGVAKDMQAAQALLEAADRRWYRRGASVAYALLQSRSGGSTDDAFVLERLRLAEAAGNVDAAALRVARQRIAQPRSRISPADLALLARPAVNGTGLGHGMLADYHEQNGDAAAYRAALQRAAEAGSATMQRELAYALRREVRDAHQGTQTGTDMTAEAQAWLEAAAQGGDAPAMRTLFHAAWKRGEWRTATRWLLAAVAADDVDAIYDLAAAYESGHPELNGDFATAVNLYEAMATVPGAQGAQARRRLAQLSITGRGVKRKPERAVALLQEDAERGDAESQALLGALLLDGADGVAADPGAGTRWMERAIAAGSNRARTALAQWLHSGKGSTAERRRRALDLLRKADPKGGDVDAVRNSQAWILCVSAYDDAYDPAAGWAVAQRMLASSSLQPGELDTVAACQAANGDIAGAAKRQQQAIDALPKDAQGRPDGGQGMFDRLALYRAGKAYRESAR